MKHPSGWQLFWEACYSITLNTVWLPISLPIVLYLSVVPIPGEWKFKRRMREANRYLTQFNLTTSDQRSLGTLICDRPLLKWNVSRTWWTEDDIHAIAPTTPSDGRYVFKDPLEDEDLTVPFKWDEYDRWLYETYLHPDHGKGMLVSSRFASTFIRSQRKPSLVTSFSGGRLLEAQLADSST